MGLPSSCRAVIQHQTLKRAALSAVPLPRVSLPTVHAVQRHAVRRRTIDNGCLRGSWGRLRALRRADVVCLPLPHFHLHLLHPLNRVVSRSHDVRHHWLSRPSRATKKPILTGTLPPPTHTNCVERQHGGRRGRYAFRDVMKKRVKGQVEGLVSSAWDLGEAVEGATGGIKVRPLTESSSASFSLSVRLYC
eukprot:SAG11_NODE_4175_length_2027_cov_1.594398_1_plen_191_part_00